MCRLGKRRLQLRARKSSRIVDATRRYLALDCAGVKGHGASFAGGNFRRCPRAMTAQAREFHDVAQWPVPCDSAVRGGLVRLPQRNDSRLTYLAKLSIWT